ncbi:hypothetical protein Vafri_3437, partial [Volvox africanus]
RLEQGAGSPASLLRLSLSGLSTTVKGSEVVDLQRLARCMAYSNTKDASPQLPTVHSAAHNDKALSGAASCQAPEASQQSEGARPPSGASWTPTASTVPAQEAVAIATPPTTTPAAVTVDRPGISSPTKNVECPLLSSHGTENLKVTESRLGPTEGTGLPGVPVAAVPAAGLSNRIGEPAGLTQASCTRSAPTSPLLRAKAPDVMLPVESSTAVRLDNIAVEPCSGRLGRRASLGDGQGAMGAAPVAWDGAVPQSSLRTSTSGAGISSPVISGAEPAAAKLPTSFGDTVEWEAHTDAVVTASSKLRLPPLPRTTCLLLCIEPFMVKYEPDEATESEWDSAAASSAAAPALIIRASKRTNICAVYRNSSSSSSGSSSSSAGAAPATATTLSLQLHGVKVDTVMPRSLTSLAASDSSSPSMTAAFWSLARTVCISSLSASAAKNSEGALSFCGAICGVRLLGPADQPGHFLLSNGLGQDDGKVTFRYWSAGSDPPPDPAEAAAAAAACVSAGWWHPSTRGSAAKRLSMCMGGFASGCGDYGADGSKSARHVDVNRSSGGSKKLGGGCDDEVEGSNIAGRLELVVSDVAVGMGLLTSLEYVCSSAQSASQAGEDGAGAGGSSVAAVQSQSLGAAAAQSSSSAEADGPLAPLAVEVRLRSCAILAISPSRTPFAAASGGSGHLACNALLSIDEVSYILGPQAVIHSAAPPAPAAPSVPQGGYADGSVLNPKAASAVAAEAGAAVDVGSMAGPGAVMGIGTQNVARSLASSHRVSVRGLLLYLADNPDSAYLSPVLLLPELRASYMPAATARATGGSCGLDKLAINDRDGVHAPGMPHCGQQLDAAVTAGTGQGQTAHQLEAMALSIDVGRVEANLQPQQVGVLCSLLAEMSTSAQPDTSPLQADGKTVQSHGRQTRMTVRQNLGTVPKRREAQLASTAPPLRQPELPSPPALPLDLGKDLAANLPYTTLSVKLGSLTALLGSDTLSEEATVLYWGGVRLSYGRTKVDVESSLAWRDLTLSSISSRLHLAHAGLMAAMQDMDGSCGERGANDAAAVAAEFKIHASSLALMHELTSYFHSTQHHVPMAATDARVASLSAEIPSPAVTLLSPPVWPPPSGDPAAVALRPSQLPCAQPVALTQPPTFGMPARGGSMQQLTDGGGGGADADAEFYSVEGSGVALDDLDVEEGPNSVEQDLAHLNYHPHMGWQEQDGAGSLQPPNADTAAARMSPRNGGGRDRIGMGGAISPAGSGSGGRRGIVLRTRLCPGTSITQISTLPAAHLPVLAAAADVPLS